VQEQSPATATVCEPPALPAPVAPARSHLHQAFAVLDTFPPVVVPKASAPFSLTPWFAPGVWVLLPSL